jgi:hypothetical protein
MLAKDTICAEMAFMFMERNRPGSTIDYPMGGSGSIIEALVRGLQRHGGRLLLRARVAEVLLEGEEKLLLLPPLLLLLSPLACKGEEAAAAAQSSCMQGNSDCCCRSARLHARERAAAAAQRCCHAETGAMIHSGCSAGGRAIGVRLEAKSGRRTEVIRARRGVISNASVWDTQALLPKLAGREGTWRAEALATPRTGSFMHLHLGAGPLYCSLLSCPSQALAGGLF